jgi:hypothetical protein
MRPKTPDRAFSRRDESKRPLRKGRVVAVASRGGKACVSKAEEEEEVVVAICTVSSRDEVSWHLSSASSVVCKGEATTDLTRRWLW